MPVRDPSSARRKRTRDAQSAFAELIARDPPAGSRRGLGAAARDGDDTARRGARVSAPFARPRVRSTCVCPRSACAPGTCAGQTRRRRRRRSTVDRRATISRAISFRAISPFATFATSPTTTKAKTKTTPSPSRRSATRALVGGGAGLSPRTLKRNERDLLRALSHSHDGGDGDAARRDVRSTHDASVGGTQEVNTQDAALDPYLRLARAARRAADGPAARETPTDATTPALHERETTPALHERETRRLRFRRLRFRNVTLTKRKRLSSRHCRWPVSACTCVRTCAGNAARFSPRSSPRWAPRWPPTPN